MLGDVASSIATSDGSALSLSVSNAAILGTAQVRRLRTATISTRRGNLLNIAAIRGEWICAWRCCLFDCDGDGSAVAIALQNLTDLGTISATITNGYGISDTSMQFWLNITQRHGEWQRPWGCVFDCDERCERFIECEQCDPPWHDAGCDDYERLQYL